MYTVIHQQAVVIVLVFYIMHTITLFHMYPHTYVCSDMVQLSCNVMSAHVDLARNSHEPRECLASNSLTHAMSLVVSTSSLCVEW